MPAIIRWNPAREMVRLNDAMERLFEDSWTRPTQGRAEREMRLPLDV